ncbi:sarcosine oxidase subunit delta [Candidatus Pelagibacter sp.]|nr:sarcosine oxidase subunit delta [Candidatus Pelagibacter sp.]|tara:strand:- start:386 stop:661 length:276 start_codon:yes stop_codon:yes gene_type:complete
MFLINCPYCGERDQSEFKAGGEAHIERPKQPTELSDDEWAEYLFMRKNIKGIQFERWNHAHGCRKWFNMIRDTSNDEIKLIYKMGEKPPQG